MSTAPRRGGPRERRQKFAALLASLSVIVAGMIATPTGAALAQPDAASAAASVAAAPAAAADPAPAAAGIRTTANLANFRAGNIISDAVFFNRNAMTEAQIQAFLQAKVPSCQSGYTCLKDWYDTSRSTAADAMCGAYSGGVRERASRIIYKVAQACGINPQVILVTLQKEQGLVTHTWPSEWRYTIAMGQGCPDTAACDTRYYGFFNQVYGAAWQMKRYANPPGTSQYFTWYAPGKTWNILYNPNRACGSSPVFVQNQATANLYYYTPYQPNAAALAAGYGTGDGCSSYGNRNFYNYFTDWFGSTQSVGTPVPTIASVDRSSFVIALDSAGTVWGYPLRNGTWGARIELARGLVSATQFFSIGDLDGDGRRDLLTMDANRNAYLRPGLPDGRYGESRRLGVDWSEVELVSAGGDFDGDGRPDVFTTDAGGRLHLWRGTQYGGLANPIQVGSGWKSMDLLVGGRDFDGDGRADLIARGTDGRLWLYPGTGTGGWKGKAAIGHGWQSLSAILSPGDVTGDGKPDLVARDASGSMVTYPGNGRGGVSNGPVSGSGWNTMVALAGTGAEVTAPRRGHGPNRDFDGDGNPDVLALEASGRLVIYRGDGTGRWRDPIVASEGWAATDRLVHLGDFDGDGRADAARIDAAGTMLLHSGTPSGILAAGREIGWRWTALDIVVGGIDFDGDGRIDVLARRGSELLLYPGDGRGGWLQTVRIGVGWDAFDEIVIPGDVDGDGILDVVARHQDGTLRLYPTTGRGAWKQPSTIGWNWQSLNALIGAGDFDGTGGVDILARNAGGDLVLYQGDGSGRWLGSRTVGWRWDGFAQLR